LGDDGVVARAHQIADRLIVLVGHVDRRQLPGTQQARELLAVAPVGLDPLAALLRH